MTTAFATSTSNANATAAITKQNVDLLLSRCEMPLARERDERDERRETRDEEFIWIWSCVMKAFMHGPFSPGRPHFFGFFNGGALAGFLSKLRARTLLGRIVFSEYYAFKDFSD